jgi:4-amino-4-deoxy-L-arabinose transferase-like glycosyltransferase
MINPSEGYYCEAAREMFELKSYLVPYLYYEQWYEKPILTFWLIIASYKIFGINEFAARLPAALAAASTVLAVFYAIKKTISPRAGFIVASMLAVSPLFLVIGHLCLTDMPLTLFLSVALLNFHAFIINKQTSNLYIAYCSLALAALTKGPFPVIVAGATLLLYFAITSISQKQFFQNILSLKPIKGLLIFLVITVPWYVLVHQATDGAFTQDFFLKQNIGRASGTVNHQNPWWYYFPVLLGGIMPWSLFLPFILTSTRKAWGNRKQATRRTKFLLFALCWFIIVFSIVSSVPTRHSTYLLPAIPPIIILIGLFIDSQIRLKSIKPVVYPAYILTLISIVAFIGSFFIGHDEKKILPLQIAVASTSITLTIFIALYHFSKVKIQTIQRYFLVCSCLSSGIIAILGISYFSESKQANLMQIISETKKYDANLAFITTGIPVASFYLERKTNLLKNQNELKEYLIRNPNNRMFLLHRDVLPQLSWLSATPTLIAHYGKFYLYKIADNK